MKNDLMVNKKKITKMLAVILSFVIVLTSAFYFVNNVEAKRNVLSSVSEQYDSATEFKILEIVPSTDSTSHANEEIGYYVASYDTTNAANYSNYIDISKAKSLKPEMTVAMQGPNSPEWYDGLAKMRNYGLVKYSGADPKAMAPTNSDIVSENPIYANYRIFKVGSESLGLGTYQPVPGESNVLVKGSYSQVGPNEGSYRVLSGNHFADGVISKKVIVQVPDPLDPTKTISGNGLETIVVPEGTDYAQMGLLGIGIEYVGPNLGDLKFENDGYGSYFGYNSQAFMYLDYDGTNQFYNGDWFKEFVLGNQASGKNILITTMSATSVSGSDLAGYDLVYVSGKSSEFKSKGSDISEGALAALYNRVAVEHSKLGKSKGAVIMDYASYDGVGSDNISKLAQLLWQDNQLSASVKFDASLSANSTRDGFDADGKITDVNTVLADGSLWSDIKTSMISGANGNFVAGNLYVYNHAMALFDSPKATVNAGDWFATGDLNSKMKDSVVSIGFEDVQSMIDINNVNNPSKQVSSVITPALAVQFILSYDGSNYGLIKSDLHVLEIQPVRSFLYNSKNETLPYEACTSAVQTNRTNFVKKFVADDFNVKSVSFTSMTIEQFICSNENLIETYDVIYIGDERGTYYSEFALIINDVTIKYPKYNDYNLYGNIYYNIGDTVGVGNSLAKPDTSVTTRFSPRDLTKEKLEDLKAYLDSNNPIIVADELMNGSKKINPTKAGTTDTDDRGRIDTSSELYELFKYGNYKDNFVGEMQIEEKTMKREDFSVYLNNPKLSLNLTEKPAEYSYSTKTAGAFDGIITSQQELMTKETVNGVERYYLSYEFSFRNVSLDYSEGSIYYASLFADVNADGRFSASEELTDCVITNVGTGLEPPYIGGTIQAYALSPNTSYRLKREIPDGYAGVLPWSLKVESADDSSVFATSSGFTVVPADKTKIKILQICQDGRQYLNLQTQLANGNASMYGAYLSNLNDFTLEITTQNVTDYIKKRANWTNDLEFKNTYMATFDMVVVGFGDDIQLAKDNAADEKLVVGDIRQFIKIGRPVLLSHDAIMFYPDRDTAKTLRSPSSQDRYGITEDSSYPSLDGKKVLNVSDPEYSELLASKRRIAYEPNTEKSFLVAQVHGYSNQIIKRYPSDGSDKGNGDGLFFVDQLNSGQITTYPYTLPERFEVAKTHNQYFQLNMEQDDDLDGQGDVVVWYTLGDKNDGTESRYSKNPGDGVNNYYIYNMGNVTYTGAGHASDMSSTSAKKYEAQLFVNTLVAAYQAANKESIVKFYATKSSTGQELSSLALPYDANVSKDHVIDHSIELKEKSLTDYLYKFVDPNEDSTQVANGTKAFVRVTDPNLVNGVKKVGVKFYLKVESGLTTFTTPGGLVLTPKEITLSNGEKHTVVDVPITLFDAEFKTVINKDDIKSGAMYGFYLPLSYLKTNGSINLIVESSTSITTKAGTEQLPKGYDTLPIAKMDLLKLD